MYVALHDEVMWHGAWLWKYTISVDIQKCALKKAPSKQKLDWDRWRWQHGLENGIAGLYSFGKEMPCRGGLYQDLKVSTKGEVTTSGRRQCHSAMVQEKGWGFAARQSCLLDEGRWHQWPLFLIYNIEESIKKSKHVLVFETFIANFRPSWGFSRPARLAWLIPTYIYIYIWCCHPWA